MFSLTSLFYVGLLGLAFVGSIFYNPIIGLVGYVATYVINPASFWWGTTLGGVGSHFSLLMAIATGLGLIIHRRPLQSKRLTGQEIMMILLVGTIWLSILVGLGSSGEESNAIKMSKVALILILAGYVITDLKRYELIIWTLVITGIYIGYQAYNAPAWMFYGGRLNVGIGGTDFNENNFLGAHFAALTPFLAILFIRRGWKGKVICLAAGVFVVNGIILCQSRGVFLALVAGGIAAVVTSIPGFRVKILFCLVIGLSGGVFLTDPGFWSRMRTIDGDVVDEDQSVKNRFLAWEGAVEMFLENPQGVGEGNFKTYVGIYSPAAKGKDAHNTYLRCLAELGPHGILILLALILNAFLILGRIRDKAQLLPNPLREEIIWHVYGARLSIIIYLGAGFTITLLYVEELYWLLFFPMFLEGVIGRTSEFTSAKSNRE